MMMMMMTTTPRDWNKLEAVGNEILGLGSCMFRGFFVRFQMVPTWYDVAIVTMRRAFGQATCVKRLWAPVSLSAH